MKHKTLRTLLCVILTVCFCLSAIAPVSAAGLFSGESGAASIFDEWIRSLKDRFTDTQPGTDETPAEQTATGDNFIRIFHLDCGRKYFTVKEIENIIDWIAENHYTHIELAFGNDGFRFLLDDMAVGGYTSDQVKAAITAGNEAYNKECNYSPEKNELTQTEMDGIITYAASKGISVIPMLDVPGHAKALIEAMIKLGMSVESKQTGNNNMGYPMYAFKAGDNDATKFAVDLVKKYVDYFKLNGSKYFNIAGDECGNSSFVKVDEFVPNLITPLSSYILESGMKPMMFNDAFRLDNELKVRLQNSGIIICYWTNGDAYDKVETLANVYKYTIINTHNKWYYIAGKEKPLNSSWAGTAFSYTWAIANMTNGGNPGEGDFRDCTACDGNYKTSTGCMVAFWCDKPGATVNYSNLKTYIETLPKQNPNYFKAASETPLPTIVIGGNNTELTVGENVIMSTSDGSLAAWSSSNPGVLTLKDNDAVEKALLSETSSVTVQAVGAGEAAITADLGNGNTISTAPIKVKTADTAGVKIINVTVGGTDTHTQTNVNFSANKEQIRDTSGNVIAEYSAEYKDIPGGTERKLGAKRSSSGDCVISDGNGNYLVIDNNGNITNTTKINQATVITYSVNSSGYNTTYSFKGNGYYLTTEWGNNSYNLKATTSNSTWKYNSWSSGYYRNNSYYLRFDNGSWTVAYDDSSNAGYPYSFTETTIPPTQGTVVTFTGLAAGNATVTIGNTTYEINVTAEDLAGVAALPISLWFTNCDIEVVSGDTNYTYGQTSGNFVSGSWQDNKKPYYISVPAGEVNSAEGKNISQILPETLLRYENSNTYWKQIQEGKAERKLVLWSGRVHTNTNNNIQLISGTDYSNSGTEFKYVRYYGGTWAVSVNGVKWDPIKGGTGSTTSSTNCTEQIAVYYMMRTEITEEVTTDVADWGHTSTEEYDEAEGKGQYVLLDFAVKYPSGTRNPNSFPVLDKTYSFHCDRTKVSTTSSSPVFQQDGYYYRQLNNFRAIETNTDTYELYMVTVTMTSDDPGTRLTASGTAYDLQSKYQYKGEEQVLWAIDQAALDATEFKPYKAITTNDTTYSGCKLGTDGYEPYVRGVEVYEAHGALITYYIRPKVTQGALTVNYYVQDDNILFYSYNINVNTNNTNSIFKEDIDLDNPWKGPLKNGDVLNILEQTEWVSADLTTMPAIGAQYRYSDFTCVKVERATDGKTVNLYYTFKADAAFVIDFGLPLKIPTAEINTELANATITKATVKGNLYGNVEFDVSQQSLIYTPTKPVDKIDIFKVTLEGTRDAASSSVTYTISIIPATNVYYEENFMTSGDGWTQDGTPAAVQQTIDKNGDITVTTDGFTETYNNVYGYDYNIANYNIDATNVTYSMDSAYKATLQLPEGSKFINTPGKLTFSFEGTGFDLISGCGANTGMLTVNVVNSQGSHVKTYVVDTYLHGDNTIMQNGTTTYQVPVVRNLNLGYDKYTVTVYGSLWSTSGAVVKSPVPNPTITQSAVSTNSISLADTANTSDILRAMLNECGLEDVSVDDVELVYMDENSVLNGGTGMDVVEEELSTASLYSLDAIADETAASPTAVVWVDAFRVYNPLGSSTASEAYTVDKEAGVQYLSLYDYVKDNYSGVPRENNSVLYIEYDGTLDIANITNYKNQGPENEVYLGPNSAIAFALNTTDSDSIAQISAKVVNGDPVLSIGKDSSVPLNATEMYYNLKTKDRVSADSEGNTYIVIKNTATDPDAVLAVSGLKLKNATTSKPTEAAIAAIIESFAQSTGTTFEPTVFEVSAPQIARKNRNFGFGVTASAKDVETVTIQMVSKDGIDVDGEIFELTPSNMNAVASGFASDYFYSKVYRIKEKGTYTFAITAYGDGGDSKTITKTVVVK